MMNPLKSEDIEELITGYNVSKWGYTENLVPLSLDHFKKWREDKKEGPLSYLSDHRGDMRSSLENFYPKCQSSLVFLFDYSESRRELEREFESDKSNGAKIASYTLGFEGEDYHFYLGERLTNIQNKLKEEWGIESKITLDIHPVLERDLAYSAGLGWFGKNSMLINRELGSFTMIGSLLLDTKLDLKPKALELDHCGNCTACIEACPTQAIDFSSRTIEASKCLSTYTIEMFKEVDPPKGMESFGGEIFGCDICQDVCPWNHKQLDLTLLGNSNQYWSKGKRSFLRDSLLRDPVHRLVERLQGLSNREYRRWLGKTSFERLGRVGLLKNLKSFLRFRTDVSGN